MANSACYICDEPINTEGGNQALCNACLISRRSDEYGKMLTLPECDHDWVRHWRLQTTPYTECSICGERIEDRDEQSST